VTALPWDLFVLVMALVCIARTLPELWLAVGDVAYQHRHGIR